MNAWTAGSQAQRSFPLRATVALAAGSAAWVSSNRWVTLLVVLALVVVGIPASGALAAERNQVHQADPGYHAAPGEDTHDNEHGGEHGGLPQLDKSSFPAQLLWLAITFSLCYFLFSGVAIPRVSQVIATRENRIAGDLDQADELRDQAEKLTHSNDEKLSQAYQQAGVELTLSREESDKTKAALLAELEDHLAVQIANSQAEIARNTAGALARIESEAAGLACAVLLKLTGKKITIEQATAAVKQLNQQEHIVGDAV